MSNASVTIRPVVTKADRKQFVDLAWEVYKDDPAWVPPLKDEVHGLIDPKKNPWFGHARAQLWLAEREGKVVGRISAQVDQLVLDPTAQPCVASIICMSFILFTPNNCNGKHISKKPTSCFKIILFMHFRFWFN